MLSGAFRATVGEHDFDIEFEGGALVINDESADYRIEALSDNTYALWLDGSSSRVTVVRGDDGRYDVTMDGRRSKVRVQNERALLLDRYGLQDAAGKHDREVHAPMPGLVLEVNVSVGQSVEAGEGLLVLEAMKMENELRAPAPGVIAKVHVSTGDAVGKNEILLELE